MTPTRNLTELTQIVSGLPRGDLRHLVAVAGPPASGKSTLAEQLAEAVSATGRRAEVVPMDGFHLDNTVLDARGLLPRKGAPQTFDLAGFSALLHRLSTLGEVVYPRFDRGLDKAIAGIGVMPADCDVAIVEGNYLCLDLPGWRDLMPLWTLSISLAVPFEELERRLLARWATYGLGPEAALARAQGNDLPNARLCVDHALPTDYILEGSEP